MDEKDPFILLATLGHKGPSCFIFEPLYQDSFSGADLLAFRKSLGISAREFAACFEFSYAAISVLNEGLLPEKRYSNG